MTNAALEDIIYRHERGTTPRKEDITFLLARAEQAERERDEAQTRHRVYADFAEARVAALAEALGEMEEAAQGGYDALARALALARAALVTAGGTA